MRRVVVFAGAAVGLGIVVACGARTGLDVPSAVVSEAGFDARRDTGSDAGVTDADTDVPLVPLSAICVVPEAGRPPTVCSKPITVVDIGSGGGCINSYAIAPNEVGVLEYGCDDASTWAAATFEGGTFQGSISDDGTFVDVCIGTHYDWSDGPSCQWKTSVWSTSQRIYGDVASGALTFTYAEKVISGDSCWIPCTALGDLSVP